MNTPEEEEVLRCEAWQWREAKRIGYLQFMRDCKLPEAEQRYEKATAALEKARTALEKAKLIAYNQLNRTHP